MGSKIVKIPGLWRFPGGEYGNPLQFSCLENPHRQRSLVDYRPWDDKESGTTEVTEQAWMVGTFLALWEIAILFSIAAAPIYIAINSVLVTPFLYTLTDIYL